METKLTCATLCFAYMLLNRITKYRLFSRTRTQLFSAVRSVQILRGESAQRLLPSNLDNQFPEKKMNSH